MKKIIFTGIIALLLGLGVWLYLLYNKPHRDSAAETAQYEIQAATLFQEFDSDENAANQKYLDKLLLVKGKVAGTSRKEDGTTSIMLSTSDLMFGISCELLPTEASKISSIKEGDEVMVKGVCTGKLMDVVLIRTVIVDNK